MHYKRLLTLIDSISSYLSVGLDIGADFTWMSIALPNGSFVGKPFKIIHSDPRSRDLAVTKIKEAQEAYSLKSRCFLESTGIYHIPLLCFLRDKGFDCSVINPIITKNSTSINIRKLHNDKFDPKKAALVGLNVSLKTSILPEDSVVDLRNLVRDYYYFKDLPSAVTLKLTAELKVSFPAYAKVFSKVTTQSSLKLLSAYPLAEDMLAASKDEIVDIIRSTARFGEAYALRKYEAIIAAAQDAAVFGRALSSNAVRIRLYIDIYLEYQKHLAALNNVKINKGSGTPVNPVVYDYYTRKCSGKKKTVSMGTVMHKICNIIFAMLRDNKPFEVITPEEHCRRFAAEHPEKAGKAA